MTSNNGEIVVAGTEQARRAAGLTVDRTRGGPAETTTKPRTVYDFLEAIKPELGRAAEGLDGLNPERIARLALTVVRRSELVAQQRHDTRYSLAACTPESFAGSLLTCVAAGLEPGTDDAYLIPRKGEVTFIAGYLGLTRLYWQHPLSYHIDGNLVRERDEFDWQGGGSPFLHFKPRRGGLEARGDIIGYYALIQLRNRPVRPLFLEPWEVEALRGRVGPTDPNIPDPRHWMEVKTVLRQLLKLAPKTPRMMVAVQSDERSGTELLHERQWAAAIDSQPPAALEGTPVNGDVAIPDEPPAPEADSTPERETITVQQPAPRAKAVMNNERRRLIKQLRDKYHDDMDAATAALRFVARDPGLHPDNATNTEISEALTADAAEIAAWQQDLALAAQASEPPTDPGDNPPPAD